MVSSLKKLYCELDVKAQRHKTEAITFPALENVPHRGVGIPTFPFGGLAIHDAKLIR